MRRCPLLLVLLASLVARAGDEPTAALAPSPEPATAQPAPTEVAAPVAAPVGFIRPGESFELRMTYGLLGTAGTTRIETSAENSAAGPRFRIRVAAQSSGIVDTFYTVVNNSESVLDATTGRPLTISIKGQSGKRLTEKTTTFDYAKGRAVHVNTIRPHHNATVALPAEPAYDIMVALMQARDWRLRPGESRRVLCVNDEDFFTIEVTALREERVKTPAGTFDAVVLEPKQIGPLTGFFKKGGALKVWISTGDRPQIVRLDTKTKIGTIVAALTKEEWRAPAPPPPPGAR